MFETMQTLLLVAIVWVLKLQVESLNCTEYLFWVHKTGEQEVTILYTKTISITVMLFETCQFLNCPSVVPKCDESKKIVSSLEGHKTFPLANSTH